MAHPSIPTRKTVAHNDKLASGSAVLCLKPLRSSWELDPVNLSPGRYLLGSGQACDLVLDFDGVAEKHALLVIGAKRTILQAYSPMTWVNNGAVSEETVSAGDRIALGPIEFLVENPVVDSHEPSSSTGGFLASDFGDLLKSILFNGRNRDVSPNESSDSRQAIDDRSNALRSEVVAPDDTQQAQEKLRELQEQVDRNRNELESERNSLESKRLELQDEFKRLELVKQELEEREQTLRSTETELEQERSASQAENERLAKLESELAEQQQAQEKLRELQEQVDQNQNELESERNSLESKRLELQDEFNRLELVKQELAERERTLRSTETELAHERSARQAENERLAKLESELAEQKQELVRQHDENLKQKAELESLRLELEAKAEEQREARASLEAKEDRLNQDATGWATRRSEIEITLQNLQEREVELSRREEELNSRKSHVEVQAEELNRHAEALKAEEAELSRRENELSEAQRDFEERAQQADLHVPSSTSEAGLTTRELELESRCQTLARLIRELKTSESRLKEQQLEFESLQQSDSHSASQKQMELEQAEIRLSQEAEQLEEIRRELDLSKQELDEERRRLKEEADAFSDEKAQLASIRDELAQKADEFEQAMQQLKEQENSLRDEIESASMQKAQDLQLQEQQLQEDVAFQQRRMEEMLWTVLTERDELEAVRATLISERENLDQKLEELHSNRRTLNEIEQVLKEEEQLLRAELDRFAEAEEKLQEERRDLAKFATDLTDWSHTLEAKEAALMQLSSENAGTGGEASTSEPTGWRAEFEEAQATLAMQADQLRVEQTEIEKLAARIEQSREHLAHRVAELERREQILGEMEFRMGIDADEIANGPSRDENSWSGSWEEFNVDSAQGSVSGPISGDPIADDDEFENFVEELASTQIEIVHDQASGSEAESDVEEPVDSLGAEDFSGRLSDATDGNEAITESERQEDSGLIYDFAESESEAETDDDARSDVSNTQLTEGQEMISDDEVRAKELRAELSQAFGIGRKSTVEGADSSGATGNRVPPSAYDSSSSDAGRGDQSFSTLPSTSDEEAVNQGPEDVPSDESNSEPTHAEESGEISIDSYMERLLSRSNQTSESKSKAEAVQKQETAVRLADFEREKSREKANKSPSPRPSDTDRKELRQKLDSFRAVANHSARQAVANSMADRERLRFQQWKQTALMSWGVTLVLILVSLLLFGTLSIVSYLAIGAAFVLTLNAVISYRSLSQLMKDGSSEYEPEENTSANAASDDDDSTEDSQ